MRILGIDPGLATLGYGIIEKKQGKTRPLACVTYGIISTPKDMPIGERLAHIQDELTTLISLYSPQIVCVESLFFFRNQTTIIQIGRVHGVLALTFHRAHIPLAHYAPLQIKHILTGNGKAEKKHIERSVKKLLGIKARIRPDDAADGLAVALCHVLFPEVQAQKVAAAKAKKLHARSRKTKSLTLS